MEDTTQSFSSAPPNRRVKGPILLLGVVIVALFAGALGGAITTALLLRSDSAAAFSDAAAAASRGQLTLEENSAVIEVVKKVGPGVVTIVAAVDNPGGLGGATRPVSASGSGVVLDPRGFIVTNAHVVAGARSLDVVFADGRRQVAEIVGTDSPFTDIAVVKVSAKDLDTLPLGDSDALTPGQRVVAIGSALGDFRNTVTEGVISGLHRTWREGGIVLEDLDSYSRFLVGLERSRV